MSNDKEFEVVVKDLKRSMKALYICLDESVANDVNERINSVMNGYQKIIEQKDKKIERYRKTLKELIFHCEDYGVKEESFAILMTVEKARQVLSEVESEL